MTATSRDAPLVVFDLDGTLVDTAPDLVCALNHVLDREGLRPLPLDSARKMIGAGARRMLERGLEAEGRAVGPGDLERLTADFIDFYAEHIAVYSRPFDGVVDTLHQLSTRGFLLAVCTNKLEWLSRRLLDQLGLTAHFATICGADTFGVSKPDPVILRQTVARAGGSLKAAVMVGDSGPDIGVARRAGVPVVGVDFGYTEIPITELAPDTIISAMAELPRVLRDLLPAHR